MAQLKVLDRVDKSRVVAVAGFELRCKIVVGSERARGGLAAQTARDFRVSLASAGIASAAGKVVIYLRANAMA